MRHATWLAAAAVLVLVIGADATGAGPRFKPGDKVILYNGGVYEDGPDKGTHMDVRAAADRDAYEEYMEAMDGPDAARRIEATAAMIDAGELLVMPTGTRVKVVAYHKLLVKIRTDPPDAYEVIPLHGEYRGRVVWVPTYRVAEVGRE